MKWHLTFLTRDSEEFCEIEAKDTILKTRQGKAGTIGICQSKQFASKNESFESALAIVKKKQKDGFIENTISLLPHFEIPDELIAVLEDSSSINTERGVFTLPPLQEIKVITVVVNTQDNSVVLPDEKLDPNKNAKGVYLTTAYSLLEGFPTSGQFRTFVWLPNIRLFGAWDSESYQLYVIIDTSWQVIKSDLATYLAVDKEESDDFKPVQAYIPIWNYFDFIPFDLSAKIRKLKNIGTKGGDDNISEFLTEYEMKLIKHPYTEHLEPCFTGLAEFYFNLGQFFETNHNYSKATEWLEKSLLIATRSEKLRKELLPHVLMQLSYCFSEMGKFGISIKYLDLYQVFDDSANSGLCENIRFSLLRMQRLIDNADGLFSN